MSHRELIGMHVAALGLCAAGCVGTVGGSVGDEGTADRPAATGGAGAAGAGAVAAAPGAPGAPRADDRPGAGPASFACNPALDSPSLPLRRLTQVQYANTVRDLVKWALKGDENATRAVMAAPAVVNAMAGYPADDQARTAADRFGTFRRLNQDVEQELVEAGYAVALAVGAQLSTRLGVVVGPCATDATAANDADCIASFVSSFGARALRRPLAADEVPLFRAFYGPTSVADPAAFADLIAGFLSAPQFLYVVEHGDQPVAGKTDVYTVSANELAARLSYHFTQTAPDDALLNAAANGSLLKDASVYAAQVDRLLADARTQAAVDEFFFDYFKLFPSDIHRLTALDARNGDPTFKTFAQGALPSNKLGGSMQSEALAMARYFTFATAGTFSNLLTTDYSFATSAELAGLYGVPAWSGAGDPPRFPPGQRPGFLTRAAFLTSGMVETRPIMKGDFIRKFVLCDTLPDPPMNAANTPIDTSSKNTRQAVEAITEQEGTVCAACHRSLINPLGFATESFDALGRLRTDEPLFDAKGNVRTRVPVDTRAVPQIIAGDLRPAAGPADLARLIDESGKAHACFARNYFRFTFQRLEDERSDGCLLERLRSRVAGGSLRDVFRDVALATEFRTRNFAGP